MFFRIPNRKLAVLLSAGLLAGSALVASVYSAEPSHTAVLQSQQLGTLAKGAAGRVVKIDATTKSINVKHMETVTIQSPKGQSFTWRFDTLYGSVSFPLKTIAPKGFDAGNTWVYVAHPYEHLPSD